MEHARPGLKKLIEKEGEKTGQQLPPDWPAEIVLSDKWGPADPIWKR
jgi:hypothetical protein